MERVVGTVVRGLRCPIINQGDSIETIVVDSVLKASEIEGFEIGDKDIVVITSYSIHYTKLYDPQWY